MSSRHSMDLTEGPVLRKLLIFVFPLILTNLLQQFYTAADVVVVGKFAGSAALAAVGSTSSITTLLLNLFNGLAVAANVICANLYGARNREELSKCMHTSILLAFVGGLGLTAIGVSFAKPLLTMMNSPENVIDLAALYMRIYFCGVPASLVYNFGAGILRAYGDTKRPMYVLSATGIVNVVLNLVLVILLKMSVAGVAIATVVAQVLSAAAVLIILFKPNGEYQMKLKHMRFHGRQMKKLVSIGIPCGFNGIVFSMSNVILQSTVNTFGDIVVAGASAAGSVNSFVYVFIASYYTACVSFAGQNFGAKKYHRIDMLLVRGMACCVLMIAAASALETVFSDFLLGLYTTDPAVVQAGKPIMEMICWSYAIYAIPEVCIGCLRGMGESAVPTFLNVFCICGLRFVWIFLIFPLNSTIPMLYLCYPISYGLCSVAQYLYYRRCRSRYHVPA